MKFVIEYTCPACRCKTELGRGVFHDSRTARGGGMAITWSSVRSYEHRDMMAARAVWNRLCAANPQLDEDVYLFIAKEANEVRLRVVEP